MPVPAHLAQNQVVVIVNAAHPHWNQLRGAYNVLNYLKDCTYDGIAEWQAINKVSRIDPDTIKILKDKLLRLTIEIERHSILLTIRSSLSKITQRNLKLI